MNYETIFCIKTCLLEISFLVK